EDGIRDRTVTGVQTCALPILRAVTRAVNGGLNGLDGRIQYLAKAKSIWLEPHSATTAHPVLRKGDKGNDVIDLQNELIDAGYRRSEERRVGKECRRGGSRCGE